MSSFEDQVKAWTDKAEKNMETAVRKIALDMFSRVILRSPVDTGRFRGNWQVAISNIPQGTLEIDDKSGTATIGKTQAVALGLKAGQSIFLVNNLPYAQKLESGSSTQAPAGMVGITVVEFKPVVEKIARELNR